MFVVPHEPQINSLCLLVGKKSKRYFANYISL